MASLTSAELRLRLFFPFLHYFGPVFVSFFVRGKTIERLRLFKLLSNDITLIQVHYIRYILHQTGLMLLIKPVNDILLRHGGEVTFYSLQTYIWENYIKNS
jgi:hypothetical protein